DQQVATRLIIRAAAIAAATRDGFLNATDLADYMVKKGLPFRDAHGVAGQAVLAAIRAGKRLEELSLEEFRQLSPLIEADVYEVLDVRQCIAARRSLGGTAPAEVEKGLERAKKLLAQAGSPGGA